MSPTSLAITALLTMTTATQSDPYLTQQAKWRADQTAALETPEGWLSVAGLYWLKPGESSIGSAPGSTIRIAGKSVARKIGVLNREAGKISFSSSEGTTALIDGNPKPEAQLTLDSTRVKAGGITFMAIQRGKRIGLRVFDQNCKGRKHFSGQKWFPIDPKWRIEARFVPFNPPKPIPIMNVLGDTAMVDSPGYVEFQIDGKLCVLQAQPAGSGLFFNFKDETSTDATYPAGRFLDAPGPVDGKVVLDFNQATNPPCAFTEFATCPLPPPANRLSVRIQAGEKRYH